MVKYKYQKYIKKYLGCDDKIAELTAKKFKDEPLSKLKLFLKQIKNENIKDGMSIYNMKSSF